MRISAEVRAAVRRKQVGGSRFPPQHRPGSEGLSSLALPSQFVKDPHRINSCLPQTCIVTNPNKSQSLFLSASAGSRALKALPPRPPGKTGRGLCAHLSAPGPPGRRSLLSRDLGPKRAVAAQPQSAGMICRLELPCGVPGVKSEGEASHRPVDLSGILPPWPGLKISPLGSSLLPTFLPLPLLL